MTFLAQSETQSLVLALSNSGILNLRYNGHFNLLDMQLESCSSPTKISYGEQLQTLAVAFPHKLVLVDLRPVVVLCRPMTAFFTFLPQLAHFLQFVERTLQWCA